MSAAKGPRVRCDLRLAKYLHKRVQEAADAAGVDLNTYINRCLADAVRNKEHRVCPRIDAGMICIGVVTTRKHLAILAMARLASPFASVGISLRTFLLTWVSGRTKLRLIAIQTKKEITNRVIVVEQPAISSKPINLIIVKQQMVNFGGTKQSVLA